MPLKLPQGRREVQHRNPLDVGSQGRAPVRNLTCIVSASGGFEGAAKHGDFLSCTLFFHSHASLSKLQVTSWDTKKMPRSPLGEESNHFSTSSLHL